MDKVAKAHAKTQRRKESQSLLCCVGFTRGPVGFAVGGLNRAEGMEVVGLLQWFKKYAAVRFTAPYEDVNTV
ncbi:MAG: hypothetical protein RL240_3539 [Planctomycetota bacterium]